MVIDKENTHKNPQPERKKNLFSAFFPSENDFESMLAHQSDLTVSGVQAFVSWLEMCPLSNPHELDRIENEVAIMRHDMEDKLIQSFSTPFDRQDIYSISRQMDCKGNARFWRSTGYANTCNGKIPSQRYRVYLPGNQEPEH
jgi:uncharacterized protein Yka (UPF0111/DUF47 family)